jgi:hypothetical protein
MVRDPRDVLVDVGGPHKVKIGDVLVIRPNFLLGLIAASLLYVQGKAGRGRATDMRAGSLLQFALFEI